VPNGSKRIGAGVTEFVSNDDLETLWCIFDFRSTYRVDYVVSTRVFIVTFLFFYSLLCLWCILQHLDKISDVGDEGKWMSVG